MMLITNTAEYAGFDFNMETDFPSEEQRKYFIQNYLRSWSSITGELGTLVDSKSFLDGFEVFLFSALN